MHDRYLSAVAVAFNVFAAALRGAPIRQLQVFLFIAEEGPQTVKDVAEYLGAPEPTIRDDIRALGKIGVGNKAGRRLIDEIPPAGPGRPQHYQLSKTGAVIVDRAIENARVALIPDEHDEENEAFFVAIENARC